MTASRVVLVAGARPNFVKVAPIYGALVRRQKFSVTLVHTGQHYDASLSDVFFAELDLPRPGISLDVGSGTHAVQTARVLERFENVVTNQEPDLVIVVGDVKSTLACALAASKVVYPSGRQPKIAHVEAGLRSDDRTMPEEINRIVTDAISDVLFTTEESANVNLEREGIPSERVFFVGNVMIDTLLRQRDRAASLRAWENFGFTPQKYGVVTLHRPSNVDDPSRLRAFIETLSEIGQKLPLVFPAHPRTIARIRESAINPSGGVTITSPLGYVEFLSLMSHARLVLTDSGGIQEETTVLGIPCLTLRQNTERPVTIVHGTNTLVGTDHRQILDATSAVLDGKAKTGRLPELWDGRAADRIADTLESLM